MSNVISTRPSCALKGKEENIEERSTMCSATEANKGCSFNRLSDLHFPALTTPIAPTLEKEVEKTINKVNKEPNTNDTTKTNNRNHCNGFASAAKQSSEEINVAMDDIKTAKELRKDGNNVFLSTPQTLINKTNRCTITYKIFSIKHKKMEIASPQQLEIALKPIWGKKSFVTKGKRFGTLEVRFSTEEDVR
uniref:Uncharacterized protein n=1 Tax=Octopus bimaculoides TaxID=37653 RepID=A0A0L8GE51_OCTBM